MNIIRHHEELCTHCGLCLDVCPMYSDIDLIDELCGYLNDKHADVASEDIFRCLTCGLCIDACPENLSLKKLITTARTKWVKLHGVRKEHSIVDPNSDNNLFHAMASISKPALFCESPYPKSDVTRCSDTASVIYYPGCACTYINTSITFATIDILDCAGVDYTVMDGVSFCCGAVSAGSGNKGVVEKMAKKNIAEIKKRGARTLITSCPGCFRAFHDMYPRLFDDIDDMDFEVLHISQYILRLIKEQMIVPKTLKHRVFYQDPCHLTRSVGIFKEPREVISSIPSTHLVNDSPKGSGCCGFGGSVRAIYPTESIEIATKRQREAKDMDCDAIVTNCPGCMQNMIEAGMDTESAPDVYDLAEYVSLSLGNSLKRDDRKMIEDVNKAYAIVIPKYQKPD